MPLFAALITWVGPIVARVLLALGFSVVTITGMDIAIGQLRATLQSSAGALGADALQLFLIGGGGVAIGLILGAINTRIALWMATKATRIIASGNN